MVAVLEYLTIVVLKSCAHCRGLKAEKIAARQAILPLIQAEEDARLVR